MSNTERRAFLKAAGMGAAALSIGHRSVRAAGVGDKLVVLSDAGEVAIVAAQPTEYQELARAKVVDGKCWSMPAFSNNRLYVRSTQEGACLDLAN